jgi:hypothetical protein
VGRRWDLVEAQGQETQRARLGKSSATAPFSGMAETGFTGPPGASGARRRSLGDSLGAAAAPAPRASGASSACASGRPPSARCRQPDRSVRVLARSEAGPEIVESRNMARAPPLEPLHSRAATLASLRGRALKRLQRQVAVNLALQAGAGKWLQALAGAAAARHAAALACGEDSARSPPLAEAREEAYQARSPPLEPFLPRIP